MIAHLHEFGKSRAGDGEFCAGRREGTWQEEKAFRSVDAGCVGSENGSRSARKLVGPEKGNPGQIVLKTNHPELPELSIQVRFAVTDTGDRS